MTREEFNVWWLRLCADKKPRWTPDQVRDIGNAWWPRFQTLEADRWAAAVTNAVSSESPRGALAVDVLWRECGGRERWTGASAIPTDPEELRKGRVRCGALGKWKDFLKRPYCEEAEYAVLEYFASNAMPDAEIEHVRGVFEKCRRAKPHLDCRGSGRR